MHEHKILPDIYTVIAEEYEIYVFYKYHNNVTFLVHSHHGHHK